MQPAMRMQRTESTAQEGGDSSYSKKQLPTPALLYSQVSSHPKFQVLPQQESGHKGSYEDQYCYGQSVQ